MAKARTSVCTDLILCAEVKGSDNLKKLIRCGLCSRRGVHPV